MSFASYAFWVFLSSASFERSCLSHLIPSLDLYSFLRLLPTGPESTEYSLLLASLKSCKAVIIKLCGHWIGEL